MTMIFVDVAGGMARIAKGRDRDLTREKNAGQTLRQFDTGAEPPGIRTLLAALGVAPSTLPRCSSPLGSTG